MKRLGAAVYPEMSSIARSYLEVVLGHSIVYANHAKRKTVTCIDILFALKRLGIRFIGYN